MPEITGQEPDEFEEWVEGIFAQAQRLSPAERSELVARMVSRLSSELQWPEADIIELLSELFKDQMGRMG